MEINVNVNQKIQLAIPFGQVAQPPGTQCLSAMKSMTGWIR